MSKPSIPLLSERFVDAFQFAVKLHAGQKRKRTQIPYVSHLMAVTALVLEDGGDEDQAIAAMLHDAVEDQGGRRVLDEIRQRYGDKVARVVDGLTDSYTIPKPPWRGRKECYIRHLWDADPGVIRVSLADKLHNARAILRDLRQYGDQVWDKFNGGKNGTLWYYRTLVKVFQEKSKSPLVLELDNTVSEIERLISLESEAPH
jgi:(p)ppGpp synthase/HD superfamily hydrolase